MSEQDGEADDVAEQDDAEGGARVEPPADLTPMPPEKSPPPQRWRRPARGAALPRESRCMRVRQGLLRRANGGADVVLAAGPVAILGDDGEAGTQDADLELAVLAVDEGLVGVVADGVLGADLFGDAGRSCARCPSGGTRDRSGRRWPARRRGRMLSRICSGRWMRSRKPRPGICGMSPTSVA